MSHGAWHSGMTVVGIPLRYTWFYLYCVTLFFFLYFVYDFIIIILQVLQAGKHTHVLPIAIETAGTWDDMAIELVQEIGRRTTVITQDIRETGFLF